ncbi:hypothetical protein [Jannaschia sp. R86511]|uniref:hypothetical protein n=1 Tax=Jannaschia sp. R86511 TaxID=3093853 RepID=UPI0036D38F9E
MTASRVQAGLALTERVQAALTASPQTWPQRATLDPAAAATAAMQGVAVLIAPPVLAFDVAPPHASATWTLVVLSGHSDPVIGWQRMDAAVTALHDALSLTSATPVAWQLTNGGPPVAAYEVTYEEAV